MVLEYFKIPSSCHFMAVTLTRAAVEWIASRAYGTCRDSHKKNCLIDTLGWFVFVPDILSEYAWNPHGVGLQESLVWMTKYRYPVFADDVGQRCASCCAKMLAY